MADDNDKPVDALGRVLRDLRISVLDQCNFRCPYCMPAATFHDGYRFLTKEQRLSFDEIETLARAAVRLGVSKLRLTGGEPLLRRGLDELVGRLARIAGVEDLALTTNGVLLGDVAERLRAAGLDRVTVSLDSLDDATFAAMSGGRGDVASVLNGIERAAGAGFDAIKINTVVQRGVNDDTVLDLLEHFRGTGHIVRLIEYMDVGNRNGWNIDEVVPSATLLAEIHRRWPVVAVQPAYRGEVAKRYRYLDGAGEIGFISSVTQPFCGDCHRARLSADGVLYTCLFATEGTSLLPALRAGEDIDAIEARLRAIWGARRDRYSELRQPGGEQALKKVEMFRIGG
ncbi:MAG: GTP 3',8-cyclase MoaA [Pseudomonadota bacterium]